MTTMTEINRFVAESNSIEGIRRAPIDDEIVAMSLFLSLDKLTLDNLEDFVSMTQPDAVLRREPGLDVIVGNHEPPPGGPRIEIATQIILDSANARVCPWKLHCEYEIIHPFTGCNGRSGRAIWAWQMLRQTSIGIDRGFLHEWYYQTLENAEE